jgi:hypothetical protein
MISPEMFERAVLPSLVAEMRSLDRSIFHLDGPDALRHLDRLLEVPGLHAVQWVYGAGNGPATRWIDVYRRIQAAGKGVQVIAGDLAEARAVAEQIRPEGAWFHIGGSYSRDDAEAFLQEMERWASTGTI